MSKCKDNEHEFRLAGDGAYYKRDGKTTGLGTPLYDQEVAYQMLFCIKCGETKEIIAKDHRKSNGTS